MPRSLVTFTILVFLLDSSVGQTLTSFSQGKLDEALDSCEKQYEEAGKRKDAEAIFHWLTGIFDVYRQKGDYDKSFFYARKLYAVAEHTDNPQWLFVSGWCLAEVYTQEGDYTDALTYFRRASNLPPTTKGIDPDASFQLEWAETYSQLDQFDSAWRVYAAYRREHDTTRPIYLVSTGECLHLNGKFREALKNFYSALNGYTANNNNIGLTRTYPDIARTCLALGDPGTALQFAGMGLDRAIASKSNPYIRDNYHILSEAYTRLGRKDSANEYFVKYSQVKEGILSDIVKAKFAAYKFEEKIAAINLETQAQAARLQKEALEKKILLGGFLALALATMAILIIARLNRKNEYRKRRLAETELELKALRARMDPHFIFNCLNSILRYVTSNDTKHAADYLTKFAKLMRMVLESSAHSFIPLEEELTILKTYLTLENLRFERPFTWQIECPHLDTSSILVPTLFIQPFVENAIRHGLHPCKDKNGTITIRLRLEDQLLHCEIEDNGIGRKLAAEIKKGTPEGSHPPMGIALTIQRLERIYPSPPASDKVKIQDLVDDDDKSRGTRVLLTIPIRPA